MAKYRIYKIRKDWESLPHGPERNTYELDFYEWPVEDGAPWMDLNGDSIYNILGQKVATLINELQKAGYHQVEWEAQGFASGIYYYRFRSGEFLDVKKMVLVK